MSLNQSTNALNFDETSVAHQTDILDKRMGMLEARFSTSSRSASPSLSSLDGTGSNSNSSAVSQHSRGFDAPCSSTLPSGVSNHSSPFILGKEYVKPKSKEPKKRKSKKTSLEAVAEAAERQMRRVLASSPTRTLRDFSQHPGMGVGSPHGSSSSNQTVQTSHIKASNSVSRPRVIAESPPILITPNPEKRSAEKARNSTDKRKSVPVKRTLPSVTDKSCISSRDENSPSRKRKKLNFNATLDDIQENPTLEQKESLFLSEHSNTSRDRSSSNQGKSKVSKTKPVNNTKIRDFFSAKKPKYDEPSKQEEKEEIPVKISAVGTTPKTEVEILRERCARLERECKDMDGKLKAVANNQTIMHSSLKNALTKREIELAEFKEANKHRIATTAKVIEKLVRSVSVSEAKEKREKLTADGARLGRIVYTRAGMRAVESWEDGPAWRQLQSMKAEIKVKRQRLEDRQNLVDQAAKLFQNSEECDISVGGLHLNDALSIAEAQESTRAHLEAIEKKEAELKEEEMTLHDEKTLHVRALKLVANEDASRFRTRPKLNDRYVLMSLLGKGGFSEVWKAYDIQDLKEVAVKIHQLDPRWSESKKDNYTKHVSREYEIHKDVRHPRIVALFDVFEIDNNSFATVLERCSGTDLDTMLKERKKLPERSARAILLQILSGMKYLSQPSGERQGIIHYDLKPGNILFDEFGDAKITDFGLSKIVDGADDATESMELTSQGAGTYWYLPPECFVTTEIVRISNKVDVWSIGVIFYQMLFGKRPFGDGMSQDRILTDHTMLNARNVVFPIGAGVTDGCKEFIKQCLSFDQALRPSIAQICRHSYILSNPGK